MCQHNRIKRKHLRISSIKTMLFIYQMGKCELYTEYGPYCMALQNDLVPPGKRARNEVVPRRPDTE